MTAATTLLDTLQSYPSLAYGAVWFLGIGIGAMGAALVAYYVRP